MLSVSKNSQKVKRTLIYELPCQMVAMESDNSNEMIQQDKSTIFVLGSDMKLLRLQQGDRMFDCIGVFDFTGYDMRGIVDNFWSHCHMSTGAITFDEYVYSANSNIEGEKKGDG